MRFNRLTVTFDYHPSCPRTLPAYTGLQDWKLKKQATIHKQT